MRTIGECAVPGCRAVLAHAACSIESDTDPQFYIKYKKIWIGEPRVMVNSVLNDLTPQRCRLVSRVGRSCGAVAHRCAVV